MRLFIYMLRWQLSTLTLAPAISLMGSCFGVTNPWATAFVGNLVGSLIFYLVDKRIFRK